MLSVKEHHIFWQPWETLGFEHLHLQVFSDAVVADSVVLGIAAGEPFRLRYVVRCDEHYRVRELLVESLNRDTHIALQGDRHGHWTDENGTPLPGLDGCIDVDISATPFTNTLPIQRLGLVPGEARDIRVVYVDVPDLQITAEPQRYTCLEQHTNGATWQYRSLGSDFVADLPVDAHGLVLDYPQLFRRLG